MVVGICLSTNDTLAALRVEQAARSEAPNRIESELEANEMSRERQCEQRVSDANRALEELKAALKINQVQARLATLCRS